MNFNRFALYLRILKKHFVSSLEITYLKMEIMVILPGGMLVLLLVAVSLISRVMSAITEES